MEILVFFLKNIAPVLGMLGFALSWANYMRDRPRIKVTLCWDELDPNNGCEIGIVRVTNVGRRTVFITEICADFAGKVRRMRAIDAVQESALPEPDEGAKLEEGDPPIVRYIGHYESTRHSKDWRLIRAFAVDSAGKKYKSPHTLAELSVRLRLAKSPRQREWQEN